MVKKFKKFVDLQFYTLKGHLEGHIFAYGRIGAGKSVSELSIIQGYHDVYRYKVFDFYGGDRCEQLYWSLPSTDSTYWDKKISTIGRFDEVGPKQYKVNFLYPYFGTKLPSRLPKRIVNGKRIISSKVFTIPIKSVSNEDIATVIGQLSETSKFCWNEIIERTTKKDNAGTLLEVAQKVRGIINTPLYKNFIIPLSRERFLMDNYCEDNLDLVFEARDTETISVLCLDFVPKAFHIFIINWLSRRLTELLDSNKIPKRNIIFMREAATFFRATEDSVLEDRFKIFRANMANYIRMGRRGMYFALDCQSAAETRGLVQGSEDYLLMFRTTSWRDKAEMCDELKRERRMRPDQIADLAFLEPGQAFIAETGRNVQKVQITLPRTMYWKKEYGNFYKNVWNKYYNEWMFTEEIRDRIEESCKEQVLKRREIKIKTEIKPKQEIKLVTEIKSEVKPLPLVEESLKEELKKPFEKLVCVFDKK